ncbi:hypothetical protein C1645_827780 [Glomus cerebriforme]|uniref:Uncharacterized protein n=1 Tax=Glomus cerebriforme TaxID=658196 RepID=A0A397SP36_9GLOM|nr:hypothetical protein C1645_827780 [Glomus cerebriforme]
MELTDQKHSSDSALSEQEVIWCTEKTAQLFGLDEQNARAYKLKRKVNLLEAELEDLDEYIDRETKVNLIQEKVPSLIVEENIPIEAVFDTNANVNYISQKHIGELGITNHDKNNSIETPNVSYSTLEKVNLCITFNDGKKHT